MLLTRERLHAQLAVAISGRAAEELVCSSPSTGSEADLEHATNLAREVVGRYGMSERIGRVRLLASNAEVYLGGSVGLERLSDRLHEEFDTEVRRLVEGAFKVASEMLVEQRELLDQLVARLLEVETLEGPDLDVLLEGAMPLPVEGR